MELLYISLIGIVFGLIARAALPARETTGVALLPAIGGVAAAIVWEALTWAGLPWDAPGIWLLTLLAAALSVVGTAMVLRRTRQRRDAQRLEQLSKAAATA